MRNLTEYPITYGETCEILQEAQVAWTKQYSFNIGGAGGLCLLYAEQFIRANKMAFDEFTKEGPVKQID